jgi:oxygen-independent coproporphyrinogen-3 oxidase
VGEHLGTQHATSLHFGGGTPNSYSPDAIATIVEAIEALTPFAHDAERSIEIDPRLCTTDDLLHLKAVGLDRVSFGVQDIDEDVQRAIGRLQSFERTTACVTGARKAGFSSVNIDLIYGLPFQTRQSFATTLKHVLELSPDRLALFGYAHVPHLRKNQTRIDESALPSSTERLAIYEDAKATLEGHGYVTIGLDHFARPDDELAVAQREGRLFRSFQGYTTVGGTDLVGVGMSSISCIAGAFAQSHKRLHTWSEAIDAGGLATERGLRLSDDEQMRAFAIERIMCNLALREGDLVARFGKGLDALPDVDARLCALDHDGLIVRDDDGLVVTPAGQPLVRHVAAAFDDVLHSRRDAAQRYSSAV